MERRGSDNIVTRPMRIIPTPVQDAIPVPVEQWRRLIARVESCRASSNLWAVAYSVFFAIGVTAGLSIVPLMLSQPPDWALTTHIAICAVGLCVGLALVIAERALAGSQQSEVDTLVDDMKQILTSYIDSEEG